MMQPRFAALAVKLLEALGDSIGAGVGVLPLLADALQEAHKQGMREGIRRYACFWEAEPTVGPNEKPLGQVLADLDREFS